MTVTAVDYKPINNDQDEKTIELQSFKALDAAGR